MDKKIGRPGFTLIELLIVVAIIAILAAIAVPNFLEAQTRSKVSRAKADMRSIATALEAYSVDANHYPPGIVITLPDPREWGWGFMPDALTTPIAYMTSLPTDEFSIFYRGGDLDNSGAVYGHEAGHPHSRYRLVRKEFYPGNTFIADPQAWTLWYEETVIGPWGPRTAPYLMLSPGPDNIEDVVPNYNVVYYDPTNGTVSRGDIGYFGSSSQPR